MSKNKILADERLTDWQTELFLALIQPLIADNRAHSNLLQHTLDSEGFKKKRFRQQLQIIYTYIPPNFCSVSLDAQIRYTVDLHTE